MTTSALDDVLDTEAIALALPGGEALVKASEKPDALYRLVAGRLAEIEHISGDGNRVVAIHRPGALIGPAQILGASVYSTTITALRDSELLAVPVDRLEALLREDPALLAEIARAALTRMGAGEPAERRKTSILGFVGVCDSVSVRDLADRVAAAMRGMGLKVALLGVEADDSPPSTLSMLEAANDYVLLAAERKETEFTSFCSRQIDRLILVGAADTPLPEGPFTLAAAAIQRHRLVDVILVQPPNAGHAANSTRWLSAAPVSRLFNIRKGDRADIDRLARVYTGRSVALVLSGGGARAYAHVGAAKALAELGVPVDFLGGASMGAVVAAGMAMGWGIEELDRRIQAAFVESSPLSDIAFPLVAMTRGHLVEARLKAHFGDIQISDLWRPFLCVSTDLTLGEAHPHRRGLLRAALRASLSLPGVLPPVVEDGHVLVDGALTRNLPVDMVREQHDGVTIGVDVAASTHGLRPDDLRLHPGGLRWLLSGAWRKGPPIVSVLIRSATLPSARAHALERDALSVEIVPDVTGVGLQDWKAYAPAVRAGYAATMAQADRLRALAV